MVPFDYCIFLAVKKLPLSLIVLTEWEKIPLMAIFMYSNIRFIENVSLDIPESEKEKMGSDLKKGEYSIDFNVPLLFREVN
jgi:hypothetical protein